MGCCGGKEKGGDEAELLNAEEGQCVGEEGAEGEQGPHVGDQDWQGVYGEKKHEDQFAADAALAEGSDLVTFVDWNKKGTVVGNTAIHGKGGRLDTFDYPKQLGGKAPRGGAPPTGAGGAEEDVEEESSKEKEGPTITAAGGGSFDQMIEKRKRVSKTDEKIDDKPTGAGGAGKDLMGEWGKVAKLADPTWKMRAQKEVQKRKPAMEIGITIPERDQEEDLFRVGPAAAIETDANMVRVDHVLCVPAKKYRGPPPLTPYPEPPKAVVVTSMANPKGGWGSGSSSEGSGGSSSTKGFLSYIPLLGADGGSGRKKKKKKKKSKKSKNSRLSSSS